MSRHTVVFENAAKAEAAIEELRRMGVREAEVNVEGQARLSNLEVEATRAPGGWNDGEPHAEPGAATGADGVLVAVDAGEIADSTVIDVLQRHGGHIR